MQERLESVNQLLGAIETQPNWREQKRFRHILLCWPEVVGDAVAAQSRPLGLHQNTLNVATSSAAWSQTLTFQRCLILEKLNQRLTDPLDDIRFSGAKWRSRRNRQAEARSQSNEEVWKEHPSFLPPATDTKPIDPPPVEAGESTQTNPAESNPQAKFQQWVVAMQARSRHLPLCPQCNTPTPPGELQRWRMCSLCVTQHWH